MEIHTKEIVWKLSEDARQVGGLASKNKPLYSNVHWHKNATVSKIKKKMKLRKWISKTVCAFDTIMAEETYLSAVFLGKSFHYPILAIVRKGVISTSGTFKDNVFLEICYDFKIEPCIKLPENVSFHTNI